MWGGRQKSLCKTYIEANDWWLTFLLLTLIFELFSSDVFSQWSSSSWCFCLFNFDFKIASSFYTFIYMLYLNIMLHKYIHFYLSDLEKAMFSNFFWLLWGIFYHFISEVNKSSLVYVICCFRLYTFLGLFTYMTNFI